MDQARDTCEKFGRMEKEDVNSSMRDEDSERYNKSVWKPVHTSRDDVILHVNFAEESVEQSPQTGKKNQITNKYGKSPIIITS